MTQETQFEINRNVLVVVPTEAFLEWARKYPDEDADLTMEELTSDVAAYLIPEQEDEAEEWLQQNFEKIFEIELDGWCTDPSVWPKDRSFEAFQKFFRTFYCSSVIDMGKGSISRIQI